MSLQLAKLWASTNLRQPQARASVLEHFDQAAAKGVEATLLVTPELTVSKKGYFARWTGRELAVVELSSRQQSSFGLVPGALYRLLEQAPDGRELSAPVLASLTNLEIDNATGYAPDRPLVGRCTCLIDPLVTTPIGPCAFRARYFHPELKRPITAFSYVDYPLVSGGELPFSFAPLQSKNNPVVPCKSLALLVQLIRSDGRNANDGFHCLSNVATAIVDLQSENQPAP